MDLCPLNANSGSEPSGSGLRILDGVFRLTGHIFSHTLPTVSLALPVVQGGPGAFHYTVLPFSLTLAPRGFTKVIVVGTAHLPMSGVHIFQCLNSWLLKANSPQSIIDHLQTILKLLTLLSFTDNESKSHLSPKQKIPFIGAVLKTGHLNPFHCSREARAFRI